MGKSRQGGFGHAEPNTNTENMQPDKNGLIADSNGVIQNTPENNKIFSKPFVDSDGNVNMEYIQELSNILHSPDYRFGDQLSDDIIKTLIDNFNNTFDVYREKHEMGSYAKRIDINTPHGRYAKETITSGSDHETAEEIMSLALDLETFVNRRENMPQVNIHHSYDGPFSFS